MTKGDIIEKVIYDYIKENLGIRVDCDCLNNRLILRLLFNGEEIDHDFVSGYDIKQIAYEQNETNL